MKILFSIFFITFLAYFTIQIDQRSTLDLYLRLNDFSKSQFGRAKKGFFITYTFYQSQNHHINQTRETALRENELRQEEEERREKVFRQHLASRVLSSFIRDFLTRRY